MGSDNEGGQACWSKNPEKIRNSLGARRLKTSGLCFRKGNVIIIEIGIGWERLGAFK